MVWDRPVKYQHKTQSTSKFEVKWVSKTQLLGHVARQSRKMIAEVPNSAFFLPEDLVIEILCFSDPKLLLRCKCVCKRWYAIIQHKYFAEMRMKCTRGQFHYFKSHGSPRLERSKQPSVYLSYVDGLILEKDSLCLFNPSYHFNLRDSYQVINPTTKQKLDLPYLREEIMDMGIYLQPSTGSYKVVAIYIDKAKKDINFSVIDLCNGGNGDLLWRTLNITKFQYCNRKKLDYFRLKRSMDGVVHFCRMASFESSNAEIISVDLEKETCTTCVVPRGYFSNWEEVSLVMLNDKPSLFCVVDERLDIWRLEDHKKQRWSKLAISLPYWKRCPNMDMFKVTIYRFGGKDFLLYTDDMMCFEYKVESNTWSAISMSLLSIIRLPENFVALRGFQLENRRM